MGMAHVGSLRLRLLGHVLEHGRESVWHRDRLFGQIHRWPKKPIGDATKVQTRGGWPEVVRWGTDQLATGPLDIHAAQLGLMGND